MHNDKSCKYERHGSNGVRHILLISIVAFRYLYVSTFQTDGCSIFIFIFIQTQSRGRKTISHAPNNVNNNNSNNNIPNQVPRGVGNRPTGYTYIIIRTLYHCIGVRSSKRIVSVARIQMICRRCSATLMTRFPLLMKPSPPPPHRRNFINHT